MKTRKLFSVLSLVVVFAMLLSACAQPTPTAVSPTTAPVAAAPTTAPAATTAPVAQARPLPAGAAKEQVLKVVHEGGMGVGPMPGLDVGMAAHPSAIFVPLFYSDKDGKLLLHYPTWVGDLTLARTGLILT